MLLKSSDFITHDLSAARVFEGCVAGDAVPGDGEGEYELELVLRKWYPMEKSREVRCFVRDTRLIGTRLRPPPHSTSRRIADWRGW